MRHLYESILLRKITFGGQQRCICEFLDYVLLGRPLAWPGDGIPQSNLAVSKDMHRPPRPRHRDIKLCLVRLAERPNRHAGNDLVDSLGLASVTGDSYSLVEMQSGASANNHAFVEYDLAIINADHGPELVIEELLTAVFDVFRESDPVADSQRDLLSLEHTEFPCLVDWQLLLDAVSSDNDSSSRRRTSHCSPLLNRFSWTPPRTTPLAIL